MMIEHRRVACRAEKTYHAVVFAPFRPFRPFRLFRPCIHGSSS
jgi:hypothetical protein